MVWEDDLLAEPVSCRSMADARSQFMRRVRAEPPTFAKTLGAKVDMHLPSGAVEAYRFSVGPAGGWVKEAVSIASA